MPIPFMTFAKDFETFNECVKSQVCQTLWCKLPDNRCVSRLEPAAPGTSCAKHKVHTRQTCFSFFLSVHRRFVVELTQFFYVCAPRLVLKQATNLLYYRGYTTISLSSKTTWGTHVQFHSVCSKRPALPKQYCEPERKEKTLNKTRGGYISRKLWAQKSARVHMPGWTITTRLVFNFCLRHTKRYARRLFFVCPLSLPPRRRRLLFTWYVSSIGIFLFFFLQLLFAQRLVGARFCHWLWDMRH
jgi:hypothetical protein